jgi:hypothetical protein
LEKTASGGRGCGEKVRGGGFRIDTNSCKSSASDIKKYDSASTYIDHGFIDKG